MVLNAEVVSKYFKDGLNYEEILEFLRVHHNCHISLSTLKRHLRQQGLVKRPLERVRSSIEVVERYINEELSGSSSNVGYRRMHKILQNKGLICRREDVRKLIKKLDPDGVQIRKRKRLRRRKYVNQGPNSVWHIDGHDKLKPFGFSIHGCIDGFSRRIIWLRVNSSNKLPEVVAKFYLEACKELKGVPLRIKADDGTEHALIEPIHIYLSSLNRNEISNSFSITTSPQNQRIESYWATLQKDKIGWWRRFFRDLTDNELLDTSDPVVLDCVRYCFMGIIREDLKAIMDDWNNHIISKSRNGGPSGRPNCMYFLPHLYNAENFLAQTDIQEIDDFFPVVSIDEPDYSAEFDEIAKLLFGANEIEQIKNPESPEKALHNYLFLLERIAQYS